MKTEEGGKGFSEGFFSQIERENREPTENLHFSGIEIFFNKKIIYLSTLKSKN